MNRVSPAAISTALPPSRPVSRWLLLGLIFTAAPAIAVASALTGQFGEASLTEVALVLVPLVGVWCARRAQLVSEPMSREAGLARVAQGIGLGWSVLVVVMFVVGVAFRGGGFWESVGVHSGRPLRRYRRIVRPELVGGTPTLKGEAAPAAVVEAWRSAARDEASAVGAFKLLGAELEAVGAPATLVERAREAARDEVKHAHLFAQAAALADGVSWMPPEEAETPHPSKPVWRELALCRLGCESLVDGAFNEGVAARVASRGARKARRSSTRTLCKQIAKDEQRHAELGWDIVQFCVANGGAPVVLAMRATAWRIARLKPPRPPSVADGEEWGLVDGQDFESCWRAVRSQTVTRATQSILNRVHL